MQGKIDAVVFPFSARKLALVALGSFIFVAIGIWMLAEADEQTRRPPLYQKSVAIFCITFFGWGMVDALRKLADQSAGLVVDTQGIIDNTSPIRAGRIAWNEVTDVRVKMAGVKFLALYVKEPHRYISAAGLIRRMLGYLNLAMYGTPLFISAGTLQTSFKDLEATVRTFRDRSLDA